MIKPWSFCLSLAAVILVAQIDVLASELSIEMCVENRLAYRVNGRPTTQGQLESLFGKLIDTNMFIYVFCESNVPASQLVQTISTIQNFGFSHILLVCEGSKDGTNGTFFVSADCSTYPIGGRCGCGGGDWKSGFYPAGKPVPPLVHAWLKRKKGECASSGVQAGGRQETTKGPASVDAAGEQSRPQSIGR